jgi:hypothetical protein
MKKLAVFALLLMIVPSVLAVVAQTHEVTMQTNFVTQGYEYARVQGMNYNNEELPVLHWHAPVQIGGVFSFCEIQPVNLPPGAFDIELTAYCNTHSGFTVMFPTGTKVKVETFVPDGLNANFKVEKLWLESRPKLPTPFPLSTVGHAVIEERAGTGGSLLFIAGIGAIVVLAAGILLASLRREE